MGKIIKNGIVYSGGGGGNAESHKDWTVGTLYNVGDIVIKDDIKIQCIADHTSTDFETDSINWVVVLEQYYHVTQEQYNKMVSDGLITDGTKDLYIIDGNNEGDNSTHKTVIFENNIDMGKYLLLAKITGANYSNNIIKFSCPNYKGVNDAGFKYENDMDIYKFELHFNTGSRRENNSYGVTLKQHGLVLYSYPLSNPKNTEPRLEEAIRLYWDYSKGDIYVFLVDIMTAIPHCVLEYTGSGTLIRNNTFVMDDLYNRRDGLNGTWAESKWKSIPYNKLEIPQIYELGGDGGSAGGSTTYTSLDALGLTAPVTVGEIFNAMSDETMAVIACEGKEGNTVNEPVHVSDVPVSFGVLTIKKGTVNRFSIEYQNSLGGSPCNVKRWIGTLKGNDGTGLYWKLVSTQSTYVALSDMGLTADATIQDVIDKIEVGETALLRTDAFTNWSTLFNGIQYGYFKVEKTISNLSNIELQEVVTPNRRYFGTQSSGKFSAWVYDKAKVTAFFNSKTFKIDITKGNPNWNGNMKFGYCVDNSYGEIIISSLGTTSVTWDCSTGVRYVKSVTYTIDPNNKAHVTIGVELYDTVYGIHQLETCGDFATINSFTGDAFTGTSVAKRGATRGRNNGVGILCEVEDLGLTTPCTTVQIAQKMRDSANGANRVPSNGMIGIFNNGDKSITDVPTSFGLLEIKAYGYDRLMIRYDGVTGNNYNGSWIGKIKGSNGTFSSIEWERIDGVVSTGGEPAVYSTSERAIGTWVDGKTIYRKTIVKDSHSANEKLISGVDTFIRGYGTCERAGYVYNVPHCGLLAGHLQDEDVTYLNFKLDTSGALSTIGSSTYTISKLKVTLEYTKK